MRRLNYERGLPLLAMLSGLPGVAIAIYLVWTGDFDTKQRWTITLLVGGAWLGMVVWLRERLVRPLQTLSNMLAALREGDYSMRSRVSDPESALGLVGLEMNTLGSTLREQRLDVLEANALLRSVMAEIDVAVFAFDDTDRLRLVNRAGARLLGRAEESTLGRQAEQLGLAECLEGEPQRVLELALPGGMGRWELRRSLFRQEGRPHRLLVLADLSRALREEERNAWQRLVRVLGHEINNSLAPIKSIAESLSAALARDRAAHGSDGRGKGWTDDDGATKSQRDQDLDAGLKTIAGRAGALSRFMSSFARLARLPAPKREPLSLESWVRRIASLETRVPVTVEPGPAVTVNADGDQLDQLLINLVDNAADAAHETGGGVRVGWSAGSTHVEVWVEDDGKGVAATANLFVPFFTTKPEGSGIGLALCRQIAEAHGGTISLRNREDGEGSVARVRLPK